MKKTTLKLLSTACAALLCASFASCKKDPVTPPSENPGEPSEIDSKPSVVGEAHGYYFAASPAPIAFNMFLNGGTFESLTVNGVALTKNQEYKFNVGTEVLTLNESYLSTLSTGDYTLIFTTNKGSCEIIVSVGGSELAEGYNMQFAKSENETEPDHFFAKAGRNEEKVKFDFLTFGDFTTEGTSLKFINLLIDKAPFDDTGLNWRLSSEDINVRLYSDGEVIYRKNFTGNEIKGGVANGMDNAWWKTNRSKPNYETGDIEKVNITRRSGVTSFSLEMTYDFLGIDADDNFRFALMECSDASSYDFNLYAEGIVELDGKALGNPVTLSAWPMLTAKGEVVRPEDIEIEEPEIPEEYNLAFGKQRDGMYAKAGLAEDGSGLTFDFLTNGDFGVNGVGRQEFLNIYLDMPAFNKNGKNWCFENGDVNVRVYSDGTIYKRSDFDGETQDNLWYSRSVLTDENKLSARATITKDEKKTTHVNVMLTWEQLGITRESFKGVRFWLAECADNDANFDYAGADLTLNGESAGVDALLVSWPMLTVEGKVVAAKDIVSDSVPAGYDLSFAATHDKFYSKISCNDTNGVTFSFWTDGDFGKDGDAALEFVQIYLDMPAFNAVNRGNWRFNSNEDIIVRIYSDGKVYFIRQFEDKADNIWIKLDHNAVSADKTIAIERMNGKTAFSLTISLEELGITGEKTLESFRFLLAECSDNSANDFNLYDSAVMFYKGTELRDMHDCNNYAKFTLATNEISLPGEGAPEGYDLSFGDSNDKFRAKLSYDAANGVTFDFWTERAFNKNGDNLEFVQIYLDMPVFNTADRGNWRLNSNEDIIVRIYSDGNVYLIRQFEDRADNIWIKLDHSAVSADKTIAILCNGYETTFSLTLSLEELGIASIDTLESFRFYLAECADGGNDFNFYGSDVKYKGTAFGDGANCNNYATFTLATEKITLASEN